MYRWKSHNTLNNNSNNQPPSSPATQLSLPRSPKKGGSTPSMAVTDPLKASRIRIAHILLGNNLNMLALLCQSTFVGDAAAAVSNTIITLLSQMDEGVSDRFIRRILKTKINIYTSKGRKMADLLRDNSMSTMVLTAYARSLGSQYIVEALAVPMAEIITYVGDTSAPKNITDTVDTSEKASEEYEKKLLEACETLLKAILNTRSKLPRPLRQICRFIKIEVDAALARPPNSTPSSERNSLVLDDSNAEDLAKALLRKKHNYIAHHNSKNSFEAETIDECNESDESNNRLTSPAIASRNSSKGSDINEVPVAFTTSGTIIADPERPPPLPPKDRHPLATSISAYSPVGSIPKENVLNSDTATEHTVEEVGGLTLSERVTGTLIFLRFIVPAITAPDIHCLLQGKVNPSVRKGLINVGKIFNGFCSEADFRQKEPHWHHVTDFLVDNRQQVKDFITALIEDEAVGDTLLSKNAEEHVSLRQILKEDIIQPAKEKPLPIIISKLEVEADEHLLLYLTRSSQRIEKDLRTLLKLIPENESRGVMESFEELKKELDTYTQLTEQSSKPQNIFARLGRKFSIKLHGSAGAQQKSKSSDDVSVIAKTQPSSPRRKKSVDFAGTPRNRSRPSSIVCEISDIRRLIGLVCQALDQERRDVTVLLISSEFTTAYEQNQRVEVARKLELVLKLVYTLCSQYAFQKYQDPLSPSLQVLVYPMSQGDFKSYEQAVYADDRGLEFAKRHDMTHAVKMELISSDKYMELDFGSLLQMHEQDKKLSKSSYGVTVLGGTFDHLHAGHKILLTMACWLSTKKVTCGISDQDLLKNKKAAEMLEPYETRHKAVLGFMNLVAPFVHAEVVPIHDPFGPSIVRSDFEVIVVSAETFSGGEAVNRKRKENGLDLLDIFVIDLVSSLGDQVADKLSSSFIRQWLAKRK